VARRGGAGGRKERGPDGWAPPVSERGEGGGEWGRAAGSLVGRFGGLGLGFFNLFFSFLFYLKI
jgi:hypothetical protein